MNPYATQMVNEMKTLNLEVKKIKRSFCIVAGVSVLDKFSTEDAALTALDKDRATYEFWAQSAGVSLQNTPAKVVRL